MMTIMINISDVIIVLITITNMINYSFDNIVVHIKTDDNMITVNANDSRMWSVASP